MGAEQSLVGGNGGRTRSLSIDSTGSKIDGDKDYKALKSMLVQQGKDFHKQVFLDFPDKMVLNRLGIFEEDKNSIKNIVIHGHGSLVREAIGDIPKTLDVPDNIVVLFMGELGYVTWVSPNKNLSKEICHKELVPNQIFLPRSTIPNVSLGAEHQEGHLYSTGIFDCELEENDNVNLLEDFEHYLIPTEKKVTESMTDDIQKMLQKATEKAKNNKEKIINEITLSEILPEISKKIPKDKYGFVYVFSCLGACKYDKKDDIELYTKGMSPLRGYTIKKIPARINVSRFGIAHRGEWNPVLTNDKDIINYRNWFVENYSDKEQTDGAFMDKFNLMYAFKFGEKWRDHLPDLDSKFIQKNDSMLRRDAFVNHFKFIDLIHNGTTKEIEDAWNMQFKDKTKFLLPRINYSIYKEEQKNLRQEVKNLFYKLQENKEIFKDIEEYYKQFENPKETIKNFIKKRDLEGLKEFIFSYMKQGVSGYENAKKFEYEFLYNEDDKDNETVKKALKILEIHEIYNYIVLFGDLGRTYHYYIENKDELKNALDIKPYIDYVNSDEYVHPEKETVIENMNKINRIFGFMTEKEKNILKLFEENDIETIKDIILGYTKNKVKDVDYWFIYEELIDEGYDENIQNIMFMHWTYDDLIRNGTKSDIERFILESSPLEHDDGSVIINEKVPLYKNALDIKPYIDYVKSDEYGHVEKKIVIDKMNEVKKLLGFTDVQQGGRVQQYGGMWQRGGFFMTCS